MLPVQAAEWITAVTGCPLAASRQLTGSTSATLYEITLANAADRMVLRLFTNAEWLQEEPEVAPHEAAALRFAAQTGLPVPELVAFDADGACCGVPAVLMSLLPGAVTLKPADFDGWLRQMAHTLATIHRVPAGDFPWRYFTYNDVFALDVPAWTTQPDLWARLLDIVRTPAPDTPSCFIHRDYHPTNVLWTDARVSGVVDWVNACAGPAGIDTGHCRLNLVSLYGVAAADSFMDHYVAASGVRPHPYWDLLALAEVLPGSDLYPPWLELGMTHLTVDLLNQRLDAYITSLLTRYDHAG